MSRSQATASITGSENYPTIKICIPFIYLVKYQIDKGNGRSGLPLKKFFNTSGLKYKGLGLKDRLPGMDEEEQLTLPASDGMLVKRPILVGEGFVLVGFRETEWAAALSEKNN